MTEPLTRSTPVDAMPSPSKPADSAPGDNSSEPSLGSMMAKLTADVSTLVRKELELGKLEMKEELSKAGKGAGMFGGAGGAGYFALLFASVALMFLLEEVMSLGLAALVIALVYTLAAVLLFSKGRKELKNFDPVPHQTVDTLKEDVQWAKHPTK